MIGWITQKGVGLHLFNRSKLCFNAVHEELCTTLERSGRKTDISDRFIKPLEAL
jgi:hypothetical protein